MYEFSETYFPLCEQNRNATTNGVPLVSIGPNEIVVHLLASLTEYF